MKLAALAALLGVALAAVAAHGVAAQDQLLQFNRYVWPRLKGRRQVGQLECQVSRGTGRRAMKKMRQTRLNKPGANPARSKVSCTQQGTVDALYLQNDALEGTVPRSLFAFPLNEVDFEHNALRGTIPSEISFATHMRYLTLAKNALTGTIPSEIGLLDQLEVLDLSENALSGTIPPELGYLTMLKELHLAKNNLTGPIPESFGLLNVLNIDVSNNHLSGVPPKNLENNKRLRCDLRYNCFSCQSSQFLRQRCKLDCHFGTFTSGCPDQFQLPTSFLEDSDVDNLPAASNVWSGRDQPPAAQAASNGGFVDPWKAQLQQQQQQQQQPDATQAAAAASEVAAVTGDGNLAAGAAVTAGVVDVAAADAPADDAAAAADGDAAAAANADADATAADATADADADTDASADAGAAADTSDDAELQRLHELDAKIAQKETDELSRLEGLLSQLDNLDTAGDNMDDGAFDTDAQAEAVAMSQARLDGEMKAGDANQQRIHDMLDEQQQQQQQPRRRRHGSGQPSSEVVIVLFLLVGLLLIGLIVLGVLVKTGKISLGLSPPPHVKEGA